MRQFRRAKESASMPYIDVVVSHEPEPGLANTLALGISERTSRILGKVFEHTAVTLRFVSPAHWYVGGKSLAELRCSSFWLDIKVTSGTNTKSERAAYLREITDFMREQLGTLHNVSYLRVDEVPGDAWGFEGISQEARRQGLATTGVLTPETESRASRLHGETPVGTSLPRH
jgi:4-oxalocrotonate tautomerase